MAVLSSYGTLRAISAAASPSAMSLTTTGPFYDGFRRTYAQIWKQQPAVRTVVDFFSRNIAQIGLKAFRRLSDDDRVRLTDHALVRTLTRPNPWTSRFRFVESTVQDLGVYANAYWLKLRVPGSLGLVRLPASEVAVTGSLMPLSFEWTPPGQPAKSLLPADVVHFHFYDPENPSLGYPVPETLRRVLAEEYAAGEYRQHFWKNAARAESVIQRPATAPPWKKEQRDDFRTQWQQFAGAKSGMTPVLEDGMELKLIGFSAKDSEYISARKLSREEVASAYHVPLPMVGILEHATFSNIREQHKQLYQDCLGPWLTMLQEEIELQLLPEFDDVDQVYLEFDINAKLAGSFEEQSASLSTAVGRPYMKVNEARARLNLPRDPDPESDRIARNLNQTTAPSGQAPERSSASAEQVHGVLSAFAARQMARISKIDTEHRAESFDINRWSRELAADLALLSNDADTLALNINRDTLRLLQAGEQPWSPARLERVAAWVTELEATYV